MAKKFLAAIDPSTKVEVSGTEKVAGRDAYKLRLVPKTDKTTVGSVTLAVDSKTWVPLQVTVMPRTGKDPAVQLGFIGGLVRRTVGRHVRVHAAEGCEGDGEEAADPRVTAKQTPPIKPQPGTAQPDEAGRRPADHHR